MKKPDQDSDADQFLDAEIESTSTPTTTPIPKKPAGLKKPSLDDFDPEKLKLKTDYTTQGAKKIITTVPVGKPPKNSFFRIHPQYSLETCIVVAGEGMDKEDFLVAEDEVLREELSDLTVPVFLCLYMTRTGSFGLWSINLNAGFGKKNLWNTSALSAVELAKKKWIKIVSNRSLSMYETFEARAAIADPVWPDLSLKEILFKAFSGNYIDDVNHPVVLERRGDK